MALVLVPASACEVEQTRADYVVSVLVTADDVALRTRPSLVAGKFARMAHEPFGYFRGSLSVYAADTKTSVYAPRDFALDAPLVPSLGDAHPENFGVLLDQEDQLFFGPNDFDASDRAPFSWDVRRLAAGVALAARLAYHTERAAENAAQSALDGYVKTIRALAQGRSATFPERASIGAIGDDLYRRGDRDRGAELAQFTSGARTARRFKRGSPDPEDPALRFTDVASPVQRELPALLGRYVHSLRHRPPEGTLDLLDAVRVFGNGVSSFAKVRYYVLVRGESADGRSPIVLELKELADSTIAGLYPPGIYANDVTSRVLHFARTFWPDLHEEPFWGTADLFGLPMQVRRVSSAHKTFRVERLIEKAFPEGDFGEFARALGTTVAFMHREEALAIATRLDRKEGDFIGIESSLAVRYAAVAERDQIGLRNALRELGPSLGLRTDASDAPRADTAWVFGFATPEGPDAGAVP